MFDNDESSSIIIITFFIAMFDKFYINDYIDSVFLLIKSHLLGDTREVMHTRNLAIFHYCDKICFLETTTGSIILLPIK